MDEEPNHEEEIRKIYEDFVNGNYEHWHENKGTNTFAVETEDAVLSRFNLTNLHNEYLGCALNVEFNGKYLLIGTHKFYPHPEAPDEFGYRVQRSEVKYKTGLCDRFCACLLTLVDVLNYQGMTDLKIRVIL